MKNITAALKLLSPAAAQRFSRFMEAARSYFGIVFGRTAAINKAERDGKFDREGADAFIDKLFGLDGQQAPDTPAAEALREILDVSPAAFSLRGVKPVPYAGNIGKAIAGKLPANAILDLGHPGPVLQQAGIPDLPLLIRLSKFGKKKRKHPELTREVLEALPAALENPMAVFTSPGDEKAHGVVTSIATSQGPVTAYFTVRDFSGKAVLEAKSIYGRMPVRVLSELKDAAKNSLLTYRNKAAFEAWATQAAGVVSDAAVPVRPYLEDLRELFSDSPASQGSDPAFSLGSIDQGGTPASKGNDGDSSTGRIFREPEFSLSNGEPIAIPDDLYEALVRDIEDPYAPRPESDWDPYDHLSEEAKAIILAEEAKIAGLAREHVRIIDDDGLITWTAVGTNNLVPIPRGEGKGKTLLHNHPEGTPPSWEDLIERSKEKLKELVVVTPGYRFGIRFVGEQTGGLILATGYFKDIGDAVTRDFQRRGETPGSYKLYSRIQHAILLELDRRGLIKYKRTSR